MNDTLDLGYDHGLETGDRVRYSSGNGTAIGGLTDGADYYAVVVDATTIRLAPSLWAAKWAQSVEALMASPLFPSANPLTINLDPLAASGSSHSLRLVDEPVTTTYTRTGDYITVTDTSTVADNVRTSVEQRKDSYQPLPGQRYTFVNGTSSVINQVQVYWHSASFWGIDWLVKDPPTDAVITPIGSESEPLPNGEYLKQGQSTSAEYTYNYNKIIYEKAPGTEDFFDMEKPEQLAYLNELEPISSRTWTTKSGWWIFSTKTVHYEKTYIIEDVADGEKYFHTHSLKADNPIQVEFIGSDAGQLTVSSAADLLLDGALNNAAGTTTLTAGGKLEQLSGTATLSSTNLILSAGQGIGTAATFRTDLQDGALKAFALNGDIRLHETSGDLKINQVTAINGDVLLSADESILSSGSGSQIQGQLIDLTATWGTLGTQAQSLGLDSGTSLTSGVTALAAGDIHLRETAGDMRVISVESLGGNVTIEVAAGGLLDANTAEQEDTRAIEKLMSLWDDMELMGAGASAAALQNIAAYQNLKTREYHSYWQYRNQQADPAVYDPAFEVTLLETERTYYESIGWTPEAISALEQKRTDEYHDLHTPYGSLGDVYDPAYSYTVVQDSDEYNELVAGYEWTEAELTTSISKGALRAKSETETRIEDANIIGHDVTLIVPQGVGIFQGQVPIDLSAGVVNLLPEQKVAIAAAEQDDLTFYDADGNIIDPSDPTLAAVSMTIDQREDVDVVASGVIIVEAGSHLYLGSEQDVNIDRIAAGDEVRVKVAGAIYSVTNQNQAHITGDDLILEAAGGSIGTVDDALRLDLSATGTLTARAEQDIYLTELAGNLNIDTVYSELGQVTLAVQQSILDGRQDNQWNVKADSLTIKDTGSAGSAADYLEVDLASTGKVAATADQSIYLAEVAGDMNVGHIESAHGDVGLQAAVSILDVDGDLDADVLGNNIELAALLGGIGASTNLLDIDASSVAAAARESIYLTEIDGPLDVAGMSATLGDIELAVQDRPGSTDDLLLRDGATIEAVKGSVTLNAGDDVLVPVDSQIVAETTVSIAGDHDHADPGVGSSIEILGVVDAGAAQISGGRRRRYLQGCQGGGWNRHDGPGRRRRRQSAGGRQAE